MRAVRDVSERDIAIAFVLTLAEEGDLPVSLMGFYDDDYDFIQTLAMRLNVADDKPFRQKLIRVARKLVGYRVLHSRMQGTMKEYYGEPTKTQVYWLREGKAELLTRGKTDVTMTPEAEAAFLLRHAYPNPDYD